MDTGWIHHHNRILFDRTSLIHKVSGLVFRLQKMDTLVQSINKQIGERDSRSFSIRSFTSRSFDCRKTMWDLSEPSGMKLTNRKAKKVKGNFNNPIPEIIHA